MVEAMNQGREAAKGVGTLATTVQTALTLALLVGAGLLIRTMQNVAAVNTGYSMDRVLTMTVTAVQGDWADFHHRALDRWAEPTLRWQPEQNFALHGFDQIAEPGVTEARLAAVDFGRDGRLIVERRKLLRNQCVHRQREWAVERECDVRLVGRGASLGSAERHGHAG